MKFPSPEHLLAWAIFLAAILALLSLDLFVLHRKPHAIRFREALIGAIVPILAAGVFLVLLFFAYQHHFFHLGAPFPAARVPPPPLRTPLLPHHRLRSRPPVRHRLPRRTLPLRRQRLPLRPAYEILRRAPRPPAPRPLLGRPGRLGHARHAHHPRRRAPHGIRLDHLPLRRLPPLHRYQNVLRRKRPQRPSSSLAVRLAHKLLPIHPQFVGKNFFTTRPDPNNPKKLQRFATTLFVVLICIEVTDLIFALDSIPAIFGITKDTFLVFTSNVFAILGLRSMYFLLAGVMDRFHYLRHALACILAFVGIKMLLPLASDLYAALFHATDPDWHIPELASLAVILIALTASIALSLLFPQKAAPAPLVPVSPTPSPENAPHLPPSPTPSSLS